MSKRKRNHIKVFYENTTLTSVGAHICSVRVEGATGRLWTHLSTRECVCVTVNKLKAKRTRAAKKPKVEHVSSRADAFVNGKRRWSRQHKKGKQKHTFPHTQQQEQKRVV